nr:50S ribosomal protein L22 [Candidatus Saccharibacteria bacterium]
MRVQAKARNLSISAQKLRLCTGGMRGLNANVALQQLSAQPKKGSAMVFDTVHSAMANAQHNHNLLPAQLVIEEIYVDGGAKLKRWRPRSR